MSVSDTFSIHDLLRSGGFLASPGQVQIWRFCGCQFGTRFLLMSPLGSEVLGRHLAKSSFRDFVGVSFGFVALFYKAQNLN